MARYFDVHPQNPQPRSSAQAQPLLGIRDEAFDDTPQVLAIARPEQHPVVAVVDDLFDGPVARRDDRLAHGHVLEDLDRGAVLVRVRHQADIHGRDVARDFGRGHHTREAHTIGHAEPSSERLDGAKGSSG